MPRFYFDFCNGRGFEPDEFGLEFDDIKAVREELVRTLPQIANHHAFAEAMTNLTFVVRNDEGQAVLRAILSLSVEHLT